MLELFMRYPGFLTKAVTLSYDDGTIHDRKMVEVLNRYGLKCTFNLNSGFIGRAGRIREDEMLELYAGHEIAVHTLNHPHLDNLTLGQVAYQVLEDRRNLERIFKRQIEGMAYPYYLSEVPGVVETVKNCGIRYSRTTESTYHFNLPIDYLRWNPTCHHAEPELPALIEQFLQPDDIEHPWRITCRLLYIWGHSYEFEDSWEALENMCSLISGQDLWYATNGEIIEYLTAFRQIRASVDGTIIYNPSNITLYVCVGNKNRTLLPGETVYL